MDGLKLMYLEIGYVAGVLTIVIPLVIFLIKDQIDEIKKER